MSAAELATVVEGWATLAGLLAIVAGLAFAGVQLRQEAKARKLQALMSMLTDIRGPEVIKASQVVRALPDGFDPHALSQDELFAVRLIAGSYARLGTLLAAGAVDERDVFPHLTFSRGAIEAWEQLKHLTRTGPGGVLSETGAFSTMMFFEQLAARAQAYLLREGVTQFGSRPLFDADWDALNAMGEQVKQARAVAS